MWRQYADTIHIQRGRVRRILFEVKGVSPSEISGKEQLKSYRSCAINGGGEGRADGDRCDALRVTEFQFEYATGFAVVLHQGINTVSEDIEIDVQSFVVHCKNLELLYYVALNGRIHLILARTEEKEGQHGAEPINPVRSKPHQLVFIHIHKLQIHSERRHKPREVFRKVSRPRRSGNKSLPGHPCYRPWDGSFSGCCSRCHIVRWPVRK